MKKKLIDKLKTMTNEQLIDCISQLCQNASVEEKLQLLLYPTPSRIEKAYQSFVNWCESNSCGHPTTRKEQGLVEAACLLQNSLVNCEPQVEAAVLYKMYTALTETIDYCEPAYELRSDCVDRLRELMKQHHEAFSLEERKWFTKATEDRFD